MVVDDSPDVRYLIGAYVEDAGVEVVAEAEGLEAALERLDAAAPDVVVVDANMPGADGYEAAGALRERRPGLPIVLLTAMVDERVRERARAAGIDACLDKGEFDRLAAVARQLAGR
jgi:CheY-like chemotaxis protein